MKGKVEVFAIASDGSEKLILSESNLIVNGGGESIVDMLTCPSSILKTSTQVVDTSNWRWGAISFGPAASSFQENAYFFPASGDPYNHVHKKTDDLCNGVSADVTSFIDQISTDHIIRVLWVSSTIGASNGATASSYTPPYQLPSYPDPLNKKLEDASTAYSIASGDGTQSYGQFENRIMFASGDASSYFQGAYPVSGATGNVKWNTSAVLVSSYEGDFQANPFLNVIVSGPAWDGNTVVSEYNANRAMDYRGFIETQYGIFGTNPYGIAAVSGVVNSNDPRDLVVDPRVNVITEISPGDLWGMDIYGGIHQIGLWSLDCKKSLEASAVPLFVKNIPAPGYIDSNGVTPREFRLFAKKTFTENLTQVKDNALVPTANRSGFAYRTNTTYYKSLKLKWTIDFRSIHD